MKQFIALCLSVMITVSMFGCGAKAAIPEAADFNFALPNPYSLTDITSKTCSISNGETAVGGFRLTDFNIKSIDKLKEKEYTKYINTIAEYPEYIAMRGDNSIAITLKTTDSSTNESRNETHYLFVKDGLCYDLWLNNDILDRDLNSLFTDSVGI